MSNNQSVLLMESDQSVIKDVTCSLRLIGIPVVTALSLEEAIETYDKYNPSLVITRLAMNDSKPSLALAEKVAKETTPVYALCTKGESSLWDEAKNRFSGVLMLPVEFPAFAKEVAELVKAPKSIVRESVANQSKTLVEEKEIHNSKAQVTEIDPEIKDRNFALAYAIQSKVLRELEKDGRLNNAPIQQVPGILNQVTAKVCIKYATEKILS